MAKLASRSPFIRRRVIKLWRVLLRVQRASLANAVLVLRRHDGHILVLPSPSGGLRLPVKQLDAWIPIATQVEAWLGQLLEEKSTPSLVAIDAHRPKGSPSSMSPLRHRLSTLAISFG